MSNSVVPPSASNSGASSTGISRRRNSTLSSSPNSSNPLTNTTVNPLANFLSVGPYRLPSSLVSGVTNRRASSGTSHRPAGSAGMVDSTSSDALLEPSLTERPSTNSSSAGLSRIANCLFCLYKAFSHIIFNLLASSFTNNLFAVLCKTISFICY